MGLFLRRLKNRKGSLTVEAAVAMPVFICVVISIAFFIRIVHVHNLVQNAIDQTAGELSTYSYIYSVTLQEAHDSVKDYLEEGQKQFADHMETATESAQSLKELSKKAPGAVSDLHDGDLTQLKDIISQGKSDIGKYQDIFNDVKGNPKKEVLSILSLIANGALEDAKTALVAEPLIRFTIKKYLRSDSLDADQRLARLNVIGGLKGLDFSETRLFKDKKSIDIIVRYKVKTQLPINILPEVSLIQRACVRAWLDGDGSGRGSDSEADEDASNKNIWSMADVTARGVKIQELQGRNLPDNFPTIAKFESGTATMIKSLNLEDATYQKPANLKSKVNGYINKLAEFKGASYAGKEVLEKDIKKKELVLVLPEVKISEENQKVLDECKQYAKENGMELKIVQAYGNSGETEEQDSGGSG